MARFILSVSSGGIRKNVHHWQDFGYMAAMLRKWRHVTVFDVSSKDFQQLRHCSVISVNAKERLASGTVAFASAHIIAGYY